MVELQVHDSSSLCMKIYHAYVSFQPVKESEQHFFLCPRECDLELTIGLMREHIQLCLMNHSFPALTCKWKAIRG